MATFGQIPSNVNFNNFQVVTSATRPSSPAEGDHIYETDTDLSYFWTGSAWAPISGQLIASTTLSSSAASIDFQNIPQDFEHLYIVLRLRSDRASSDDVKMEVNGDTTAANYVDRWVEAATSVTTSSSSNPRIFSVPGTDTGAGAFSSGHIILTRYSANLSYHEATSQQVQWNGGGFRWLSWAWAYSGTVTITRLTFKPVNGPNFIAGSHVSLYGMR